MYTDSLMCCVFFAENSSGRYPLTVACNLKSLGIIEFLLKFGADPNKLDLPDNPNYRYQLTPLITAIESYERAEEKVDLLLRYGVDVEGKDAFERTPLFVCAERGRDELLGKFIELGADVNAIRSPPDPDAFDYYGDSPFMVALEKAGPDTAKRLFETGRINVNYICEEMSTLFIAVKHDLEATELVLKDVSAQSRSR